MRKYLQSSWLTSLALGGNLTDFQASSIFNPDFPRVGSLAVTRTDIQNYCRELCEFEVSRRWVELFISRRSAELTENKSSRQEEPRLQVPRIFLEETIRRMHETRQVCSADLAFHHDEGGISDGEDRKPKRVVAQSPSVLTTFTIKYLGM
jgi:hypothetical protein